MEKSGGKTYFQHMATVSKRRDPRHEPSFGSLPADGQQADSVPIPERRPGGQAGGPPRRRRRRPRRVFNVVLNILALALAVSIGAGGYFAYERYMEQHVSLDDLRLESETVRRQDLYLKPTGDAATGLGEPQLKWCLRQQAYLDALGQVAATNTEFAKLNELQQEVEALCDYGSADPQLVAVARESAAARQDEYYEEALNSQLLFLGGEEKGEWRKSQLVSDIQTMLDALGYDVGLIDGLYGTQTRVAIKAFEREAGLPETGLATEEILAKMRKAANLRNN